jgi:hypothetical protein
LKGTELLRRCYEEASAKASLSRTPLHPVQQKSTINSTPTNSTNITIKNRTSLWQQSALNTLIPSKQPAVTDRQGEGVSTANTSTGCGQETSCSKQQNCPIQCRNLATNSEDATAGPISNHSKKHLHGQKSKQSIEQSPQPSLTCGDIITKGNSTTPLIAAAGVTMTTEVTELEMDLTKEGSTEVTPERLVTLNSGSTTKRRLKLEDASSCKPQTKRRRISKRDSSGSSGRKSVANKSDCSLQKQNLGQRTMQSYFQPA